jgi:hypothetical protein
MSAILILLPIDLVDLNKVIYAGNKYLFNLAKLRKDSCT